MSLHRILWPLALAAGIVLLITWGTIAPGAGSGAEVDAPGRRAEYPSLPRTSEVAAAVNGSRELPAPEKASSPAPVPAEGESPRVRARVQGYDPDVGGLGPAPGVRVHVSRGSVPLEQEILHSAVTDGDGRVEIPLGDGSVGSICVWLDEPGYQRSNARAHVDRGDVRVIPPGSEIVLTLTSGSALLGRTYGPDGRPCTATVSLRQRDRGGVLEDRSHARSSGDGWFCIGYSMPGSYDLFAESPEGTAGLRSLALDMDPQRSPVELFLVGDGLLRGRLVDGNGESVGQVRVIVRHVDISNTGARSVASDPSVREAELAGGGRVHAYTWTGADGRFEFAGLRSGGWHVDANGGGEWTRVTTTPVPADGTPVELTYVWPHLLVRLDGDGIGPGPGTPVTPTTLVSGRAGNPAGEIRPVLYQERPDGNLGINLDRVCTNEYRAGVEVGHWYLVGAVGGGQPESLQRVFVPSGSGAVVVEVPLQ